MTTYAWTIPEYTSQTSTTQSDSTVAAALRKLFGSDIWLDVSTGQNADRIPTAAGDWTLADGEEAVRQSLLRRIITSPGDWKTKPEYGVGARRFLKQRATQATADELITLIRGQFGRDKRVEAVLAIEVQWTGALLRLAVATKLKGRALRDAPLFVSVQVR